MSVSSIGPLNPLSPLQGYARGHNAGQSSIVPARTGEHGTFPEDTVRISAEGRQKSKMLGAPRNSRTNNEELSQEERQTVSRLQKRDMEVKAHEAAHMAAGSGLAGSAAYQYTVGPDGKRYVTGGEVPIDVSGEKTPQATIRKMQQVRRAALAPAQPSGADRAVAAQATKTEQMARMELSQEMKAQNSQQDAPADPVRPGEPQAADLPEQRHQASHRQAGTERSDKSNSPAERFPDPSTNPIANRPSIIPAGPQTLNVYG